MEINFTNITVLAMFGFLIWGLVDRHIFKKNYDSYILSLPKKAQEDYLKGLLFLIKAYRFTLYFLPIIATIAGTSIKIYSSINFYFYILIMVLLYINALDGYFFDKRLYGKVSKIIYQNKE